jgi:uncharacterized protein YjbI with pentapeptide repeats
MPNQEHLEILKQGVEAWNKWREEHTEIQPLINGASLNGVDLSGIDLGRSQITNSFFGNTKFIGANFHGVVMHGSTVNNADLSEADLSEGNFSGVNFTQANLFRANFRGTYLVRSVFSGANLCEANLNEALLRGADFSFANLGKATLIKADLSTAILTNAWLLMADLSQANLGGCYLVNALLNEANLMGAYLKGANFSDADLSDANLKNAILSRAILVGTNLTRANLTHCFVHGISCWDVELEGAIQLNLDITPSRQPTITVDNLEIAQFIYLLLNNTKIRQVIDTISSKVVLILGRFTDERKQVLDAIRDEVRKRNYSPVLFDFEKPVNRDITETVSTLAHMARFVIADITDAKSVPQELKAIVPNLPSVPVQPLILNSQHEYGMFEHFTRFPWVLPLYRYSDEASLLKSLKENVIDPAEQKAQELANR